MKTPQTYTRFIQHLINIIDPTIKFTVETEIGNNINFLDISIQNKGNKLLFIVQRKPTATDVIIPKDSCPLP
jgi:hypothetical protein